MLVHVHRRSRLAVLAIALLVPTGCGNDDPVVNATSLQSVQDCLVDRGLNANDTLTRYETEPAFKRGVDECTADAGMTANDLLETQREMERADTKHLQEVAACMAERGRPVQVEVLADGSSNLGDFDRYFTPDTLDEFFDDYADCNGTSRADLPTENGIEDMEEASERR